MPDHRLKIGLSACFSHADPKRSLFTNKTLQYVEQSIAHWLMSAGALVVMIPCPTGETARGDVKLSHYAEWLDVRASDLRRLNKMSFATPVIVGRKVKLSFAKVTHDQFEARRMEYHRQLQEVFFTQFRIKDTATHVVRSGDSLWSISQARGVSVQSLLDGNDLTVNSLLRPGRAT